MTCGHQTRHGQRIGCCARCGLLFSSDTSFTRHRKVDGCVPPETVGLVARPSRSHPDETVWSTPGPAARIW